MRIPRIFVEQRIGVGQQLIFSERSARHVRQVLRLRTGQKIVVFDGSGRDYDATLTRCDRQACCAAVDRQARQEEPASLSVHLGIGLSRGERMDFVIQKSVELGVAAITPLVCARTVVRLNEERTEKRLTHWQGIVIGACEQSGRSLLPELHSPSPLTEWLDRHRGGLMLHHRANQTLAALPAATDPINLLVGPEGGLDEAERALAERAGFVALRLGPRVLRTETAPLAALASIQALWGDFR